MTSELERLTRVETELNFYRRQVDQHERRIRFLEDKKNQVQGGWALVMFVWPLLLTILGWLGHRLGWF